MSLKQIPLLSKSLQFYRISSWNLGTRCFLNTKIEANENEPIKFSTSGAAKKTVVPIMRTTSQRDMPWYQPYSVIGSVTVFLIYFCVLRQENDVDLKFDKTLYERIHGLEKEQLLQSYRFNKEHGKSVVEIEERLNDKVGIDFPLPNRTVTRSISARDVLISITQDALLFCTTGTSFSCRR